MEDFETRMKKSKKEVGTLNYCGLKHGINKMMFDHYRNKKEDKNVFRKAIKLFKNASATMVGKQKIKIGR